MESEFYTRFVELVQERLADPDLQVSEVAAQMGLGQSQFTRKIKALTNYTPVELIRSLRLQKAKTMLLSTEKTVGEIAYAVGFTSLAYFSKCYKEAFGCSPTDTRDAR
ncbi:MAG: helix-turn-helix transcriptional regulator [Muribaculaceae bacterium]|nr:helix-turn-helix transcriptional regulator [Muribaculaceae bacterium]